MKKLVGIAYVYIFTLAACYTRKAVSSENITCTTAKVHYGGDPRADGVGWVLITDSVANNFETADNLAASFKIKGKLVDICYTVTAKDVVCFCTKPKKMIHITSIKEH